MVLNSLKKDMPVDHGIADLESVAKEDHLEKLFTVFRQIDNVLGDCAGPDELGDAKAAGLIDAQTVVIRTAAALPARSMNDLLYKLALWRWDAPELDQPIEDMNRSDAIVYSAFRDLVRLLSDTTVLKGFDKAN